MNAPRAVICEAKNAEPTPAWAKLKKADLAQLAAKQVADTDWLPEPLRIGEAAGDEDDADTGSDVQSNAV